MTTSNYGLAVQTSAEPASNVASWLSLLFGLVAIGMTLVSFLPGSSTLWISGAGVVAIIWGILAFSQRARSRAGNVWAPVLGILLGLSATAITVTGIGVIDVVHSATAELLPTASKTATANVPATPPASPEPFVFATNPVLTSDGTELQQIATALNQSFAGGNSTLGTGQAWPKSLKFSATQVLTDSGTPIVTVAAGHFFGYRLSADQKSYTFAVSSDKRTESAVYNSATNRFSFVCPVGDTTCVPVS